MVGFLITGATLALAGRYCERVWGGKQLAIFVAIQSGVANIMTALVLYLLYVATRDPKVV